MELDRRTVIAAGALGIAAAGCSRIVQRVAKRSLPETLTPVDVADPTVRLLERVGYGPLPGQAALNQREWIEEQLSPTGDDDPVLVFYRSRLDVNRLDAAELRDVPERSVVLQLQQNQLLGAAYSRWQLRERMVDFWTNHFNIFNQKNYGSYRLGPDQKLVVHKHALGSFPEMVKASAHSAAMLGYLDNQVNVVGTPNENYARELLELHTLGVHGGYTQADVKEVARAFTGWGIENRFLRPRERFAFDLDRHDTGAVTVMGRRYVGHREKGEAILETVSTHPTTARFIAGKLSRHFLGSAETPERDLASSAFLKSDGDIAATLRPILLSDRLLKAPPIAKRPYDYVVSAIRRLGAETDAGSALQAHLSAMGQPLYGWPMPDGYPDRTQAWTGSLLARWSFAWALAHGSIDGTPPNLERVASLYTDAMAAALHLTAPAFQYR